MDMAEKQITTGLLVARASGAAYPAPGARVQPLTVVDLRLTTPAWSNPGDLTEAERLAIKLKLQDMLEEMVTEAFYFGNERRHPDADPPAARVRTLTLPEKAAPASRTIGDPGGLASLAVAP